MSHRLAITITIAFAVQLMLNGAVFAASAQPQATSPPHDRAFWRSVIAHKFQLPDNSPLASATIELAGYVDEADPELRDQFGYEIQRHFLHDTDVLSAPDLSNLYDAYLPHVLQGLGEQGTDSVFARSFAMLNLKELAAVDLTRPFLTQSRFDELFAQAELALRFEQDLRGFDEKKGWAHATAHAADLMRVLARNAKLTRTQQTRLIKAVAKRARATQSVFVWGEDARLAGALMLVVHRSDFDSDAFQAWFASLRQEQTQLWQGKFDSQNYVHLRTQANVLSQLAAMIARNDPANFPEKFQTDLGKILAEVN